MNVGYGMIGVMMLNVGINLLCFIVTSLIALFAFCEKACKRKKNAYRFEVRS